MQHAASAWFDDEAALDAATVQFWSPGYEGTSVRDLAATMSLKAASRYEASATSARSRNARSNDKSSAAPQDYFATMTTFLFDGNCVVSRTSLGPLIRSTVL